MEITYVYQNTESGLYTVGYYNPTGKWVPESDHDSSEAAASRVHYLNGGLSLPVVAALRNLFRVFIMCQSGAILNSSEMAEIKAAKKAATEVLKATGGI